MVQRLIVRMGDMQAMLTKLYVEPNCGLFCPGLFQSSIRNTRINAAAQTN
jgi:hypothetical protein